MKDEAEGLEHGASRVVERVGLIAGPLLAVTAYLLLPADIGHAARAVGAVAALMAAWWITEAVPLPATSLLPVVLFPLLGATTAKAACASYADDIIFLFAGGLILGLGMQRWGLHRRIALITILLVGTRPRRLIGGFMLATAVISMWVSNTATAVLMLPIGASVVDLVTSQLRASDPGNPDADRHGRAFAVCLMLAIAYGASIGGLGTLIGTPPNLVFAGYVKNAYGREIQFLDWMRVGIPLMALYLPLAWAALVFVAFPVRLREIPGGRALIRRELSALGPPSSAEVAVFCVFMVAVLAWITRQWIVSATGWTTLSDAVIAMTAALVLFIIPAGRSPESGRAEGRASPPAPSDRRPRMIMDWQTAVRIPWGVLILFGGGLSLGAAMSSSGLDLWIGDLFSGLGSMPTWLTITVLVVAVVLLSELASNTAVATAMMPVLGAAAVGMGLHPYVLLVPAALAASCGFMLPVATPPNTVVFSSGYVTIRQMLRAGFLLDVIGIALVVLLTLTVLGPLLGEDLSRVPDWAAPRTP